MLFFFKKKKKVCIKWYNEVRTISDERFWHDEVRAIAKAHPEIKFLREIKGIWSHFKRPQVV